MKFPFNIKIFNLTLYQHYTGAKDIDDITRAFLCIYEPFVLRYRDTENLNTSSSSYRVNSKKRKHEFV